MYDLEYLRLAPITHNDQSTQAADIIRGLPHRGLDMQPRTWRELWADLGG